MACSYGPKLQGGPCIALDHYQAAHSDVGNQTPDLVKIAYIYRFHLAELVEGVLH